MQRLLFTIVTLGPVAVCGLGSLPTGKCRVPIPSYPGMNISAVEGEIFKYVYTPDASVFKFTDSIAMLIKQVKGNLYTEIFHVHTIFGTTTRLNFNLEYLGDGVLKMNSKKGGGTNYMASIVAIENNGNVGLLYVCSDQGTTEEDFRYVIVRKEVDPDQVEHPDILFKVINDKYNFKGMFHKLPLKSFKKS